MILRVCHQNLTPITRLQPSCRHVGTFSDVDYQNLPAILKSIENKWKPVLDDKHYESNKNAAQRQDEVNNINLSDKDKSRYVLSMFPYPSGNLHLGHVRIYTSSDVISRFLRLKGINVINPMGFDSFGLPAENAARQRGVDPGKWIESNIDSMRQQMNDLSFQFDWREATSDPAFYRWTQELFVKLFNSGLAYKSFAQVNWDPVDQTVLADEQVDENGLSWRSGAPVQKRYHKQWFVKSNAFCNDIYNSQDVKRTDWHDVIDTQRNWIGKPNGWLFYLPIQCRDRTTGASEMNTLLLFTDEPNHFLRPESKVYIDEDHWLAKIDENAEHVMNPFTGRNMEIEILSGEDRQLLPPNTKASLAPHLSDLSSRIESPVHNTGDLKDETLSLIRQASRQGLGAYFTSDKYRDWLISRQRYWGTPIPAYNCKNCGIRTIEPQDLPVTLPIIGNLRELESQRRLSADNAISSPLRDFAPSHWLNANCNSCGSTATRETDTCDTLFDSSWYFLRYATEPSESRPFDGEFVRPVWCYIGGKEHASMHLFYARFVTHFLHSQGLIKFKEPFEKLLVQGVVKSPTYRINGKYITKSEADDLMRQDQSMRNKIKVEYEKMSKSKGNGIEPSRLLSEFGIDATRFCLLSYVNPDAERLWKSDAEEFKDILIYLRRIGLTLEEYETAANGVKNAQHDNMLKQITDEEMDQAKHKLRDARCKYSVMASFFLENSFQFRQYISCLHSILNSLRQNTTTRAIMTVEFSHTFGCLCVMLSPIAPHFAEECWSRFTRCAKHLVGSQLDNHFKFDNLACEQSWPLPDADYPVSITVTKVNNYRPVCVIYIDRAKFDTLNEDGIKDIVAEYLDKRGEEYNVVQVQLFRGYLARVSVNKRG